MEVEAWFRERGFALALSEVAGVWSAVLVPCETRIGAGEKLAQGRTKLEAARNAQDVFEARERGETVSHDHPSGGIELDGSAQGDHRSGTVSISGGGDVSARGFKSGIFISARWNVEGVDVEQAERNAEEYGWRATFVDELDGKVSGWLHDEETGETLKSAVGEDFHDAWLNLGAETYPPSAEGRRARRRH